MKDEEENPYKS